MVPPFACVLMNRERIQIRMVRDGPGLGGGLLPCVPFSFHNSETVSVLDVVSAARVIQWCTDGTQKYFNSIKKTSSL